MIKDNDIIGGNVKDNGPLDALFKGEQISADALILIRLREVFALKARECNEHQDFEDKGGARWGKARHEAWIARQRRLSAFETACDSMTEGFNKAAEGTGDPAHKMPIVMPVFAPKAVPGT